MQNKFLGLSKQKNKKLILCKNISIEILSIFNFNFKKTCLKLDRSTVYFLYVFKLLILTNDKKKCFYLLQLTKPKIYFIISSERKCIHTTVNWFILLFLTPFLKNFAILHILYLHFMFHYLLKKYIYDWMNGKEILIFIQYKSLEFLHFSDLHNLIWYNFVK